MCVVVVVLGNNLLELAMDNAHLYQLEKHQTKIVLILFRVEIPFRVF
jgi:hypothetical protein